HLDEFGIKCVLIGHSERRALGDEEFIKAKFDFAKEHGYKIVFKILQIIMYFSPIAAFSAMAVLIAQYGIGSLINLAYLLLV
ncbi:cation:dicarboxylate symporter family transporter, partial [Campylobacter jejuni]|uniref:cation:dicarboxylate symporter family transporter n=1 Tax=Campylobacter jejuni TaxID=197 RepID=UPI0032D8DA1E